MHKEIIRNKSVSFSSSTYYLIEANVEKYTALELQSKVLNEVCKETNKYDELKLSFLIAQQNHKDNEFFVSVDRINEEYSIKINDKITIYHFSKKNVDYLEWRYPSSFAVIGKKGKHSKKTIVSDFLSSSYLHFYFKYMLDEQNNINVSYEVKEENESTYIVNNVLKILFDTEGHVWFEHENTKKHICDSWWSTNQEILKDLISMPMLDFGKYYKAFWLW